MAQLKKRKTIPWILKQVVALKKSVLYNNKKKKKQKKKNKKQPFPSLGWTSLNSDQGDEIILTSLQENWVVLQFLYL